ncbi:hypothetical protein D3C77_444250 [compost metagenome]
MEILQPTLDAVCAQIRVAEAVLQQLDSRLEAIRYDPAIPSSIETAIKQTLAVIDELLADFKGNSVLEPMVDQLKAQYLETIEHKVIMSQASVPRTHRRLSALAIKFAKACNILRGAR